MLKLGEDIINLDKEGGSFGIENIKTISADILKAVKKFKNRSQNGLNFWEKVRTGLDFSQVGGDIIQNIGTIKEEVLDLSGPEMSELAEFISLELGINYNDSIKAVSKIVLEVLNIALSSIDIYKNIKTLL